MKEARIKKLCVGLNGDFVDVSKYDKVVNTSVEYEDALHIIISFYQGDEIVRQLINMPVDIEYEEIEDADKNK